MTATVLITGSNRGIGLEFARQYCEAGYQVYAACRSPEKATALLKLQQASGDLLQVLPLDVCNSKQINNIAKSLKGQALDILINNAGVYGPDNAELGNLDSRSWLDTFAINCIAPIKIIEALQPSIELGSQKKIINITSKMGSVDDNHSGGSYVYRSSKAALNMAIKSIAVDTRKQGFISVLLHPGWVKTDMGGAAAEISVTQSVNAMKAIIDKLSAKDSGQFFDVDGRLIPW